MHNMHIYIEYTLPRYSSTSLSDSLSTLFKSLIYQSTGNSRMGKSRDLFKKIRDNKGTFYAKMGTIKNRNGMNLTEAEDIKKSWQEYTEELYKKEFNDPDNHSGDITHLEPDILECEVKWALESITTNKASGGDGIPVELFQILEDDTVKALHSICQQIRKTQQWPQDWKTLPGASVRNPARDKVMRKEADIRKACSDFRDPSGNS